MTVVMTDRVDEVNRPSGRIRYGWPLSKSDWDSLPLEVCSNPHWQYRPLGPASRTSVPPTTGVYMLCARPPRAALMRRPFADMLEVLYVGRSTNLRNRYADHIHTPSPKVRAARRTYSDSLLFWFLHVEEAYLAVVETLLINCFGPPANDQPGDAIQLVAGQPTPIR